MGKLILYDRSRSTTDWSCQRMRYLQYEKDGRGIVSQFVARAPYTGQALHDGLAAIAISYRNKLQDGFQTVGIDDIADAAHKQMFDALMNASGGEDEFESTNFANEQSTLVEGILRGFYKYVWPTLIAEYPTIVAIEEEMTFEHDDLVFMARPDLVVEDREGNLIYIEYKSTSSKQEGWTNSWNTAIQLHSTIRAIEATLGRKVTGVIIQGLYKGFISYGKQSSPFCYGYGRGGNPPFTKAEVRYDYAAGFKRTPTWEMSGGVAKWIEDMPDNVLADQFPRTPVIFVKDELVDNFFKQRAVREGEIKLAMELINKSDEEGKEAILNMAFPQNFEQCHQYFGKSCQFLQICHGQVDDPLNMGFEYRTPHHQLELEQDAKS